MAQKLSKPLTTRDPLMSETSQPEPGTTANEAELGQDVARLMSPMPESSRQYRETGRDLAVQRAAARWPLLLEILSTAGRT